MFGVGWTEMLLIGIVALVVIGPKDLPVVMNRLGKVVATIRRMGGEFQREINKTTGLDQITDLRRSITEPIKQTAAELTREFNKTTAAGTTVPSGVITPKDPASESVVAEIHEKLGMTPATGPVTLAPPVMTPKPVESPAPIEALAPKPRKPRAKKAAVAAEPVAVPPAPVATPKPRARKAAAAAPVEAAQIQKAVEAAAPKPARKPRTPKPKADS